MRYLVLYLHFVRFSFSRAMEFRLDFYFRVLMDIAFYVTSLAFFKILYGHTDLLGGWTLDQIYVFACSFMLVDALHMAFFANNLWWLPILVNRGDLDYYLVRPVSSLFFLSLREFAANSFMNVVIAAGITFWAIARYPLPLSAGRVAVYLCFIALGTLIHFLLRMMFIIPVFWIHSAHGLTEVSWTVNDLGERPIQIYRPWLRWALLTILPLAFMATIPTQVLFEGPSAKILGLAGVVTVGLGGFVLWFWSRGLAAYSSASS